MNSVPGLLVFLRAVAACILKRIMILKRIFKNLDGGAWTGLICPIIGALVNAIITFGFHKMWVISWLAEDLLVYLMFIETCIIVIVEEWKTNLTSLAILFHFLCAQHVSDINISIIRSLRLCWWIITWVVLFSVRFVLELWCGWF